MRNRRVKLSEAGAYGQRYQPRPSAEHAIAVRAREETQPESGGADLQSGEPLRLGSLQNVIRATGSANRFTSYHTLARKITASPQLENTEKPESADMARRIFLTPLHYDRQRQNVCRRRCRRKRHVPPPPRHRQKPSRASQPFVEGHGSAGSLTTGKKVNGCPANSQSQPA